VTAAHTTGAGFWSEGLGTLRARSQDSHENLIIHGTQDPCVSDIAFTQGRNNGGENVLCQYGSVAGTLSARHDSSPCADRGQNIIAIPINTQSFISGAIGGKMGRGTGFGIREDGEPAYTIQANHSHGVATRSRVRRLTPLECERLQGFPDGHTDIQEHTPDGPRYKALGNSMAVPCMSWLGQRLDLIDRGVSEATGK
jgi:DNA (cytosine-5)-methyltransferase 1